MTMGLLNRSAIILRPKPPFLEWAKQDDTTGIAEDVFNSLRNEPHVFLLPEHDDDYAQREVLEDFWRAAFEAMLNGWVTDKKLWPKKRSFQMFQDWFEIQIGSAVEDLYLDEPLEDVDDIE